MKKIKVKDVFLFLSEWSPVDLAEAWDHVGLQLGSMQAEVKGVLVSLDVTQEVLAEAKRKSCNLLITHHPLALDKLSRLSPQSIPVRLAKIAHKQKVNILSFHTNLDSSEEGLNDLLARRLKLPKPQPLIQSKQVPRSGMGRISTIKAMSYAQFLKHLAKNLSLKNFRYVGDLKKKIRKVAVVTGSGAGYYLEAKKKDAEVLVTGDLKYHTALDALAEKMCIVDIGHFEGEVGMQALVAEKLRSWPSAISGKLKIYESKVQKDPFQFWPA